MNVYTLENTNGLRMRVSEIGGAVMELRVPDRSGMFADIVLGYDSVEPYRTGKAYLGALIGRYGNRIANGAFSINGSRYELATNNGANHLHGGVQGFNRAVWKVDPISGEGFSGLVLTHRSHDGEEGYPGNLDVQVTYKLTDANEWVIEYEARTDEPTFVNLTQHTYFNLAGHDSGEILDQEIQLNADSITPVAAGLIPTGEIVPVAGTPFDFRTSKPIGRDIGIDDAQIAQGQGYDHNFVLKKQGAAGALEQAALARDPSSGRTLETFTTEPGVQFYSGNCLTGSEIGKGGVSYARRNGFCLETQHFPNSPNQPQFPSTLLRPGESYRSSTVYRFGVD